MTGDRLQPFDHDTTDRSGGRPRRRTLAAVLALAVAVLGWAVSQARSGEAGQPPTSRRPALATASVSASPGRHVVTWQDVAGLAVPLSIDAGPMVIEGGRVSRFAHSDPGAAYAAVHLLVRTFPFAGSTVFRPTIAAQVTGPDAPALARLTEQAYEPVATAVGVKGGGPIRSEGGYVAGYRLDQPGKAADAKTVHVLIRQAGPATQDFTEYHVRLLWRSGDWRLIAPPWGDWRNAATAVTSADPGQYLSYDPAGAA